MMRPLAFFATVFLTFGSLIGPVSMADEPVEGLSARLYFEETGIYRVGYEELVQSGFTKAPLPSAELALFGEGEAIPLWVEDGGDGRFDVGDYFEFLGQRLSGQERHYFEYSRFNVYRLSRDASAAQRMISADARPVVDFVPGVLSDRLIRRQHLEEDRLMIRIGSYELQAGESADIWFWSKMSHLDAEPLTIDLDLGDYDPTRLEPIRLSIQMRGLSSLRKPGELAHHRVEAFFNGHPLDHVEWDGRTVARLEAEIPSERLIDPEARLQLHIPVRQTDEEETLIDVVVLDWIRVEYPYSGRPPADQVEVLATEGGAVPLRLHAEDVPVVAYDAERRITVPPGGASTIDNTDVASLLVVTDDRHRLVSRIELDRPSTLRRADQQSDYLMIAHSTLMDATRPLAELHRQRGLSVRLIDVQDVYDEFSHGVVDPHAIRDFIAHAYHQWQEPRPRFVLLVGDASWDIRNDVIDDANYANWTHRQLLRGDRFVARRMTPYAQEQQGHRNLIPTWDHVSREGHSASDNRFVTVDGDDIFPDLAIGRFPVTQPEEVAAIVAKTARYLEEPEVGPWRRNVLWITNENAAFQHSSDRFARRLAEDGYHGEKVYPQASEADNATHQSTLQDALNQGQLLVHFYGHGGRHIWRTGPPDFRKNHDLFTLDHVEALKPNNRLPLILSMTCYSAPFDHPSADSIGEKFLRVPDRGAVAVFAASWRNSPSRKMSTELMDQLITDGTPIGVAIQHAKTVSENRTMIEMYNLLGDPAIELALPSSALEIDVRTEFQNGKLKVAADLGEFSGRARIDGVDEDGNSLVQRELKVSKGRVRKGLKLKGIDPEDIAAVQVYVWNETSGIDGLGTWVRPRAGLGQASDSRRGRR